MMSLHMKLPGRALLGVLLAAIGLVPPLVGEEPNPEFEIAERPDPIVIEPPVPACPTLRSGDITTEKPLHHVKLFFPWFPDIDESTIGDGDLAGC